MNENKTSTQGTKIGGLTGKGNFVKNEGKYQTQELKCYSWSEEGTRQHDDMPLCCCEQKEKKKNGASNVMTEEGDD